MNRAWVVLSSVGTGPQPPRQKWYHLTVQGPKVHLGDIDQNREGPSLTHQMAESIISGITDDQGELPLLMSITELIATQFPKRSRSQCQGSDSKMIAVPHSHTHTKRCFVPF